MLSVNYAEYRKQAHYAECRHVECRYAECRYAECHGAGERTCDLQFFPLSSPTLPLSYIDAHAYTCGLYYKTFYGSNLRIFVIS